MIAAVDTAATEPPWRYLDKGIRDLVRLLWGAGFCTTDSGDGVSKPEPGRVLDVPHVFVRSAPDVMVLDARRAAAVMAADGYRLDTTGDGWLVEATYSPIDGVATLAVIGPPPTHNRSEQ